MPLTTEQGADRVLTTCAQVTSRDTVLVLKDPTGDAALADALVDAATRAGATATMIDIEAELLSASLDHDELTATIAGPLHEATLLLGVTGATSLYHSSLGRWAAAKGARVLALTRCTRDTLLTGAIEADFTALAPQVEKLRSILDNGHTVRITTAAGTDLHADITGRPGHACTGRAAHPGDRMGFPDIEAFIAPVEESVTGQIVIDASTTTFGLIQPPVTLHITGGVLTGVDGARSREIMAYLSHYGPSALTLAELGFGLNPAARIVGRIVEDEAALGTAHVAMGNNASFGGHSEAPIHEDFVYRNPTVYIDDTAVIHDGIHDGYTWK